MKEEVLDIMKKVCQCDEHCTILEDDSNDLHIYCNLIDGKEIIELIKKKFAQSPFNPFLTKFSSLSFHKKLQ